MPCRRPPLLALLLLPALAGCLEPNPRIDDAWPIERPAGWDSSPELAPYDGFRAHSADQTLAAAPAAGSGLGKPAGCAAYQDGRRSVYDHCAVDGPDGTRAWSVHATWDGRGEDLVEQERDEGRRTVVAFAADGSVVAHVKRAQAFAIE